MNRRRNRTAFFERLGLLLALSAGAPAFAGEVLFLTNGSRIAVDRYWEEGDQIFYQRNGGTFGFPRHLLERVEGDLEDVEASAEDETGYRNAIATEEVDAARRAARDGDLDRAARLFRTAIAKAPDEVFSRIELARIELRRGELYSAQSQLEQAKRLDPDDAQVRELLGDVYHERGRTAYAIREWQLALADPPDPGILFKLRRALEENDEDIVFEEVSRPNFVIRYEGAVNAAVGRIVAAALDEEYDHLARELRFTPSAPVVVTLYTNEEFRDVANSPSWASALNDGEIRLPVEGVTEMTAKFRGVLRHELTHSFVNAMTAGNCPAWFHEGLAQLRESDERPDVAPRLRAAKSEGALLPLWNLEGALTSYPREKALLAYAQALSATEYLRARRGRDALIGVLRLLAQGRTMDEALKEIVGLDYREFQTAWEADLTRYHRPAP